jgi:hypothetical protein
VSGAFRAATTKVPLTWRGIQREAQGRGHEVRWRDEGTGTTVEAEKLTQG